MKTLTRSRWRLMAGTLLLATLALGNQSALAQTIKARENGRVKATADSNVETIDEQSDANAQAPIAGDVVASGKSGVEVLTSGPIHEAFAPVITLSPQPGVVAGKAPPDLIDETPPDQRPAGANVAWIPGYWAWDGDRDDFVWVTGLWRTIPPGRQWVPGYWVQNDQGYQWVTGYWGNAQAGDIDYLPEPPALVDEEAGAPPSADQVWVPGCWVWSNGDYAWQPGYWMQGNANWNWNPGYYVWSPRGYVYVDGYYDYAPAQRGLLFAPIYVNAGNLGRGFAFSPLVVINPGVFLTALFVNPAYGHYYYGNYYGSNYANAGYYPWFAYNSGYRGGYDPIFAGQRWQNRENRNWEQNLQSRFDEHRKNAGDGKAGNAAATVRTGDKAHAGVTTIMPLNQFGSHKDNGGLKLQPVSKQEQKQLAQSSQKVREFGEHRQQLEGKAEGDSKANEASKGKLAKSPIVGTSAEGSAKTAAPPAAPETPKTDPSVTHKATPDESPANKTPATGKGPNGREPAPRDAEPNAKKEGTKPGTSKIDAKRPGEPSSDAPKTTAPRSRPEPQKPDDKPESKPSPKPEAKPSTKPEPKPEAKPESKPKAEPKPETRPEPKPSPKPEAKPEPKPAPRPEAKPAPKPETKPEPKPAPRPETKPEPKPQPKPAPNPETKREPKPVPQQPKPEPKPEPKPKA